MQITFILKNNTERTVDFVEGQTILQVAEDNRIALHGACEGFGVCGGCHVVIENLPDKLPESTDLENDALDRVGGVTMHSRLACQLPLNNSLNGLRIKLL
ncbi:MAG: 2Fe-2S iron-sulfur cluster binding domain-containing protein [Holosporaceae bacterium]|jgi:2Fe-2S ferredoxin|nr:2Fe-2S iron-sulfur cluster binding domain-containing protein [Holosporaceae bacterium]